MMPLGLMSNDSTSRRHSASKGRSRTRVLRFENLDRRCVLSATPLEVEVQPDNSEVLSAETAEILQVCSDIDAATSESELAGRLAVKELDNAIELVSLDRSFSPKPFDITAAGETYGMTTMSTLEVTEFTAMRTIYGWMLSGRVVFSGSPYGLSVTFGGLITGSIQVSPSGLFNYFASLPDGTVGQISAQAIQGNLSSPVVWTDIF